MAEPASIPLVKAHALGNDFLLVAAEDVRGAQNLSDFARRVCDRHRGIGADGLMVIEDTPDGAETRLFNADGGEAEVSGNGVRSAAAWLAYRRLLVPGQVLVIGTSAGPKRLELLESDGRRATFRADMGPPADIRRASFEIAGEPVTA